jgi:hypothetical protein
MAVSTVFLGGDLSDAGVSAKHTDGPLTSLFVAPATGSESNLISLPLVPIACWRMDDARFDFDSAFLRPTARREFDLLREVVQSHPGCPLSIFGHSDPTGDDAYNKQLSGRRARSVYAALVRRVDLWEELYGPDRWGSMQVQTILHALKGAGGSVYYPEEPDGKDGPKHTDALRAFQGEHALPPSGRNDAVTRAKLFRTYMDFLCTGEIPTDTVELTAEDFLGRGADAGGKGAYQGCGEFNPVLVFSKAQSQEYAKPAMKSKRDAENLPNRRVTAFLFPKGRRIAPEKWPCPRWNEPSAGCRKQFFPDGDRRRSPQEVRRNHEAAQTTPKDTFACRFYDGFAERSPCEGTAKLVSFRLRLCDLDRNPLKGAPCRITQGKSAVSAHTDPDEGCVLVIARQTPEKVRVEWGTAEEPDVLPHSLEMYVSPGAGDEGAFQRLHNVGYSHETTLEEKVKAFQKDLEHPETGTLTKEESDTLFRWHDGGEKPFASEEPVKDGAGPAAEGPA